MILTIIFFLNELFDIYLNNKSNLLDILLSYFIRFKRSQILFFITQFNFIFLNFCVFALGIDNFSMVCLCVCYWVDCLIKIYYIHKFSNKIEFVKLISLRSIHISLYQRIFISFVSSLCFYSSLT